jgi:hypothetical protein
VTSFGSRDALRPEKEFPALPIRMFLRWIRSVTCQFCLLLVVPAFAATDAALPEGVLADISHKIIYVNAFGQWENDSHSGYYRVILLDANEDFPHSRIYIQWIASVDPDAKEDNQIIATASVVEINQASVFKLSVPRISDSGNGNAIDIQAVNQYTQEVQNLRIAPSVVGDYDFSYVQAPDAKTMNTAVEKIPLVLDYYVRPTF